MPKFKFYSARQYIITSIIFFLAITVFVFSNNPDKNNTEISLAVLSGDCNTDNKVDILDFQLLSNSFGKSTGQNGFNSKCDFNTDNRVDILDFQLLSNNFGRVGPTNTPTPQFTNTPTPIYTITATKTPTPNPTITLSPPSGTISVDLSRDLGLVTHKATGFLGITLKSTDSPPEATFMSVKPQLASWITSYSKIAIAEKYGFKYQFKLRGSIPTTVDGDWTKWESYVATQAQTAKNNGYRTVEFDIWNEPDCCGYWPYGDVNENNDDERYYQMWIRAYRKIKNVDPNFTVVGPSVAFNTNWVKNKFLPRVKRENALPDVLSWHFIGNTNVYNDVNSMRTFLQSNGYPVQRISINEYGDDGSSRNPSIAVLYIYEIERAGVESAARACWQEGGTWNCEIHMGNLLLYDYANKRYPTDYKRSVYWAYKAYADMTGSMVGLTPYSNIVGVASKDNTSKKAYVLLGNRGSSGTYKLTMNNLNTTSFYVAGQPVNILVQRIPDSGSNALPAPITVQQTTALPVNNSLNVNLNMTTNDAFFVTLY